jgi:16S rRNA (uracil1498-N3)-methyltransferase
MRIRRLFSPDPPDHNQMLRVAGDEFNHLKNVLRYQEGQRVDIFDGRGTLFQGVLAGFDGQVAKVRIEKSLRTSPPPVRFQIGVSVLKRRSMLNLVDFLSEMGVDEIHPLVFSRTDVTFYPKQLEKWKIHSLLALRINGRLWPARIREPATLEDFLASIKDTKSRFFLDLEGRKNLHADLQIPLAAVVGPPGDFTDAERNLLLKENFVPCKINDCILKSETAACSIAAIIKNEFLK